MSIDWKDLTSAIEAFYHRTPKMILLSGSLFILSFLIAFFSFSIARFSREKHLVFFLEYQKGTLGGEIRSIPWKSSLEDRVLGLVEELLWGPMDPRFQRVFPLGSKVQSLLIRSGNLYVDLSPDVLFASEDIRVGWDERFRILRKTLSFNYPRFKQIFLTVNGQLPGNPPFLAQNPEKQKKIR
ncbi:MAG: GerMN domain-containing protein [Spirochaetes bacterium]|nr:GerMN domain-containing protein [Spirochaetota bacterium]